jgi:hypothetical protein
MEPSLVLTEFLGWVFRTVATAAEAELNDDTALREQLLNAEMQREMGEISDGEFAGIEAEILQRIREIKERRSGGSGPLEFAPAQPIEAEEGERFQIEAEVAGDFYGPDSGSPEPQTIDVAPVKAETVEPRRKQMRRPRKS